MALTKSLSFSLGRKRILISNNSCDLQHFCDEFDCFTPLKKLCSQEFEFKYDFSSVNLNSTSLLEALPQELLIKVICGVDHDDLKRLFFVSKAVRDAAIIAKNCHFAYSTPSKTKAFRDSIDMLNDNNALENSDFEAPNAPKQARKMNRKRLDSRKLEDISVALFTDEAVDAAEQRLPRRSLFMDIDS